MTRFCLLGTNPQGTLRWMVLNYDQMKTIPFSEAHAQLAATMDQVVADHMPVVITRPGSKACVRVSLDDWGVTDETEYLMSSPANAARLNEAIRALETGDGLVTIDSAELLGE